MGIHFIPYKPLSRCGIEELAVQQRWNEHARNNTGGVMFARKDELEEHEGKDEARQRILDLLTLEHFPARLCVLSMPGLSWSFETGLLRQRDPNWRHMEATKKTSLTCLENDRFVYYSAATKMPGNKHCCIVNLPRPAYAERAIGHGIINTYAFANVDDLMREGQDVFDVAWLDYTGPMSIERMKLIQKFWAERVRHILVVTSLKARWNKATSETINRHGGALAWMRRRLPGEVLHSIEYQDGPSPMAQLALRKPQ